MTGYSCPTPQLSGPSHIYCDVDSSDERIKRKETWDKVTAGLIIFLVVLVIIFILGYFLIRRNSSSNSSSSSPKQTVQNQKNPQTLVVGANPVIARIGASSVQLPGQNTSEPGQSTLANQSSFMNGAVQYNNGIAMGRHGAIECNKSNTRFWGYNSLTQSNQCQCISPFYGPRCDLEAFDQTYTAVGLINSNQFEASLTEPFPVDRLSFPLGTQLNHLQNSDSLVNQDGESIELCTAACSADPNCYGVYYQPAAPPDYGVDSLDKPTCQLLHSLPTINLNQYPLIYDSQVQSTLFLKDGLYPILPQQAFLYSEYTNNPRTSGKGPTTPIRPWLQPDKADNLYQKTIVVENIVSTVNYRPTHLINTSGRAIWISSQSNFSEYIYIDPPNPTDPIQIIDHAIPQEWSDKILYAKLV